MTEVLAKELETYEAKLENLLGSREGKFVLVYGEDILGTFDSQMDAVARGYLELGNVPFLVKQVLRVDVPLSSVSNLLRG